MERNDTEECTREASKQGFGANSTFSFCSGINQRGVLGFTATTTKREGKGSKRTEKPKPPRSDKITKDKIRTDSTDKSAVNCEPTENGGNAPLRKTQKTETV